MKTGSAIGPHFCFISARVNVNTCASKTAFDYYNLQANGEVTYQPQDFNRFGNNMALFHIALNDLYVGNFLF